MRAASLAWLPDGRGFYYTRYPGPNQVPAGEEQYHRAVYFHALGTDPATDPLIFKPAEKEHWPGVSLSPDGRWLLVSVARTFDETDVYLKDLAADTGMVAVARDLQATFDGEIAHGRLFLRTNLDAPTYRLYMVDPRRVERDAWREIVPPRSDAVLDGITVAGKRLALSYLERASSRLRLVDLDGVPLEEVTLPTLGSLFGVGAEWDGDEVFYGFSSYTLPPSVYRIDLPTGNTSLWKRVEADVDPGKFEVRQVTYRSKDGTPISMFLVHATGLVRDGNNPTYLTGYGGFNISMTPAFSRSLLLWLEHGGLVAIPNIRGGGEYGAAWNRAGSLLRKQNTVDDYIAATEHLVAERYTSARRIVANASSAGGVVAAAAVLQRPELYGAAILDFPVLDMMRYHLFTVAGTWKAEYGTVDDPAQFEVLRRLSAPHNVRGDVCYPPILVTPAENDQTTPPFHAYKFVAALQHERACDTRLALVRVSWGSGHGFGKNFDDMVDNWADQLTFVDKVLERTRRNPADTLPQTR
jgi:prolyl oligopeptidase